MQKNHKNFINLKMKFIIPFLFFATIFPPLFPFIIGHRIYRLFEGETLIDQNNSFDHQYLIHSKCNRPMIFPYNNRAVCILTQNSKINGQYQIQLESAYTFHTSAPRIMELTPLADSIFHACFEYDHHSFLIYQNGGNNETHIIRSGNEKVFKFFDKYERFIFDHIQSRLYIQIDDQWLYRLNLDKLVSKFWSPSIQWGSKNARILLEPITQLSSNCCQDVMIANGVLYWIEEDSIYRRHLHLKQERIFVSKIGAKIFSFIPFPHAKDKDIPVLLSTTKNNFHNCIAIYLAIIKACVIALLVWLYRKPMMESIRKRFKKTPSYDSEDGQFELSGGIYPTAPLFLQQNETNNPIRAK